MSGIQKDRDLWEGHAKQDPMWAILSDPARKGRKWTPEEFFATGRAEIAAVFDSVDALRVPYARTHALDFGCGVGRLSQALAERFDRVTGVDISQTMVDFARRFNRFGDRVTYICNQQPHLKVLPDAAFSFIYTDIVLQHIQPEQTKVYLREFARVLAPGGAMVFQLPSHLTQAPPPVHAMPDSAYRAGLTVTGLPATAPRGSSATVRVTITNRSKHPWQQPSCGPLSVGNHWIDASTGRNVINDDGRAALPSMLAPGESAQMDVVVRMPSKPGAYICEFDAVHEYVAWFEHRGSTTLRVPIEITAAAPAEDAAAMAPLPILSSTLVVDERIDVPVVPELLQPVDEEDLPQFPMNGVPSDEVIAMLSGLGLRLLHTQPDDMAGPDWVSYKYFWVKDA